MVKKSERVKAYHPRVPHKEGCMCAVCGSKRLKLEALVEPEVVIEPEIVAPPPPPTEVRLDSLPIPDKFMLGGQEHLVRERVEDMVLICNLVTSENMTLGGATMVLPIKKPIK